MNKTIKALILPIIIIIIWAILTTYTGIIPSYLIPSPSAVWVAFENLLMNGSLITDTISTLTRVFLGFIFIIFLGSIFPILINTADGVKRTDKVYTESAYTLGANQLQTLTKVVVPSALPNIITGLKVGIGIGLMCTVAAEMIGSSNGLGYLILTATSMLDSASAIVGMLTIGLIGLGFDYMFRRAERKINW